MTGGSVSTSNSRMVWAFARGGALIIAQENAGLRMRSGQIMSLYGPQKAYPPIAWPAITFDTALRLRWNGDEIDVIHVGPAHTDDAAVVFFRQQNVIATGDTIVVPGHGEVADRVGLQDYRDRLVSIRDGIVDEITRGLSEDEVVALHPTEGLAKAGRGTDRWVRIVYREYHR